MDTYLELRAGIQDFLGNASASTARCDTFIDLCESWFNTNLRVWQMETTNASFTVTTGLIAHPADWVGWKNLAWMSGGRRYAVQPIPNEQRDVFNPGGLAVGIPEKYFATGDNTRFDRPVSGSAAGTYYQKIPALGPAAGGTSNWLLASHQDAYLYGSLIAAKGFYYDDSRMVMWGELFKDATDSIKQKRASGQVYQMTPDFRVP